MSEEAVIRVEGIGKLYRVGEHERYTALRDVLARALTAPFRRKANPGGEQQVPRVARKSGTPLGMTGRVGGNGAASATGPASAQGSGAASNGDANWIWALKDVTFEVKQGEVVGLIGRNGAGKSTLLKVLSRITKPTEGYAEVQGRMGSLLEVGAGFHPELTGRENIFLNGAILGMRRAEIARKFDEIVAFAEIERFIDTAVKYYSSGMYVRLAFAVAAHLETEILFVDEVLAVGDAAFQKKCLGRMGQVSREGRTVIFVSHNMAAMKALCGRGILIRDGRVAEIGPVVQIVDNYLLGASTGTGAREWSEPATAPGNENIRMVHVRILPPDGAMTISIDTGALIEIGFENLRDNINLDCTVYVTTSEGVVVFESGKILTSNRDSRRGFFSLAGRIPPHLLNAGRYTFNVLFGQDQRYVLFRLEEPVSFEVDNTATGRGLNMSLAPGVVRPLLSWEHSFEEKPSLVREA